MVQITDHKHCEICGNVIGPSERWCSVECHDKHDEIQKGKKRSAIIFVIVIVAVVILTKIPSPF